METHHQSMDWEEDPKKKAIDIARNRVARLINCSASEITFTSCGSESDNMVLKGNGIFYKSLEIQEKII